MRQAWSGKQIGLGPSGCARHQSAPMLCSHRWLASGSDGDSDDTGDELKNDEEMMEVGSGDLMSTDAVIPDEYPELVAIPLDSPPLFPRFIRVLTVTECV